MLRDLISRYNSDGGGKMQQMERDLEELVVLGSTDCARIRNAFFAVQDVADITQNALAKAAR